jgi:hypothetical protein
MDATDTHNVAVSSINPVPAIIVDRLVVDRGGRRVNAFVRQMRLKVGLFAKLSWRWFEKVTGEPISPPMNRRSRVKGKLVMAEPPSKYPL